jgi:hypothetical protein
MTTGPGPKWGQHAAGRPATAPRRTWTVAYRTEQALRDAMERLLTDRTERTDGKLTKNSL